MGVTYTPIESGTLDKAKFDRSKGLPRSQMPWLTSFPKITERVNIFLDANARVAVTAMHYPNFKYIDNVAVSIHSTPAVYITPKSTTVADLSIIRAEKVSSMDIELEFDRPVRFGEEPILTFATILTDSVTNGKVGILSVVIRDGAVIITTAEAMNERSGHSLTIPAGAGILYQPSNDNTSWRPAGELTANLSAVWGLATTEQLIVETDINSLLTITPIVYSARQHRDNVTVSIDATATASITYVREA